MAWLFVNKGTGAAGNNLASVTAALPASTQQNDLLIIIAYSRYGSLRTPDLPSGWSEAERYNGGSTYGEIAVFYKIHDGSESDVAVAFSGAGQTGIAELVQMAAFRGSDTTQATVLGNVGTDSTWAASQNIGPVTAVTLTNNDQLLLVIAARQQDMGTNGISNVVNTLTGDSQTWFEIEERGTTGGNDAGYVWDYAFTTGTPTITNKTFTNSNTQTAAGCGMMVAFKTTPGSNISVSESIITGEFDSAGSLGSKVIVTEYVKINKVFGISVFEPVSCTEYAIPGAGQLSVSTYDGISLTDYPITQGFFSINVFDSSEIIDSIANILMSAFSFSVVSNINVTESSELFIPFYTQEHYDVPVISEMVKMHNPLNVRVAFD